mmetsp:Transcript_55338/g.124336  ORF Transcript_55338/g.124336 Transcript_55338/m.124336 type:complete len:409 (-) Transcript_55338:48-1274(-)
MAEKLAQKDDTIDDDEEDEEDDDDYDSTDSSGCEGENGGGDMEERQHFLDVCYSLIKYDSDARRDIRTYNEQMASLEHDDLALWTSSPSTWIAEIVQRVEANTRFLAKLPCPDVCGIYLGQDAQNLVKRPPDDHRVASRNSSKVRSTLRQFVRDWSVDGEAERKASYEPIIHALETYMPVRSSGRGGKPPTVLCPGCGLGRLPFELARRGYAAQGNEFSYHMLLGSHLMLNGATEAESYVIYPYVLSTANRSGFQDHLREVRVPDVCAMTALPPGAPLSMAAGEFVDLYQGEANQWDAVASVFFLDTAKNVYQYIRVIATIIPPGGLWINLGPLLYHYAEASHDMSVEPSWEEVRTVIAKYFNFEEEREHVAHYTANPYSLMSVKYRCMLFIARRNDKPATGFSHPVF